jgi:hypothetical protein
MKTGQRRWQQQRWRWRCERHSTAHHPTEIAPETSISVPTGGCCNLSHYYYSYSHREEQDIYVGAHYDPHLLSDYGGNLFHHHAAKLMQHNVRDIDLHLIPPWEYYDKLHPGTMVLCNVMLHLYQMNLTNAKEISQKRKVRTYISIPFLVNSLTRWKIDVQTQRGNHQGGS